MAHTCEQRWTDTNEVYISLPDFSVFWKPRLKTKQKNLAIIGLYPNSTAVYPSKNGPDRASGEKIGGQEFLSQSSSGACIFIHIGVKSWLQHKRHKWDTEKNLDTNGGKAPEQRWVNHTLGYELDLLPAPV